MGVAISLRNDKNKSFYKNMLIGLMNTTDANELLLCTGYLQYDFYPNASFKKNYVKYNVFKDADPKQQNLLDTILRYKKVTIVGIKGKKNKAPNGSSDIWYDQYKAARDYVFNEKNKRSSKVDMKFYYDISGHWHAKLAILMRRDSAQDIKPIAAIIGSSNLTRPAFADTNTPRPISGNFNFNFEGDTLIYVGEASNAVNQQLDYYSDLETGEVLSYADVPQIYGSARINSEADVIKDEYNNIMSMIQATGKFKDPD